MSPAFFAVGLFAMGQFAVKKKNLTEPNLPNLTENNIFFMAKYPTAKNPATILHISSGDHLTTFPHQPIKHLKKMFQAP